MSDWDAYRVHISRAPTIQRDITTAEDIDMATLYLQEVIIDAANMTIPKINPKRPDTYPEQLRDQIRARSRARKLWKRNLSYQNGAALDRCKAILRKSLKAHNTTQWK